MGLPDQIILNAFCAVRQRRPCRLPACTSVILRLLLRRYPVNPRAQVLPYQDPAGSFGPLSPSSALSTVKVKLIVSASVRVFGVPVISTVP